MPTVVTKRCMSDQQDTASATLNLNAHSCCSQRSTLSSVSQSTQMDAATAVGTEVSTNTKAAAGEKGITIDYSALYVHTKQSLLTMSTECWE